MVTPEYTIWELIGGMLLFGVVGYIMRMAEEKAKKLELKKGGNNGN